MSIENQQPGFPEGYDPHAEVEHIMRDNNSDMREHMQYETVTQYSEAETRLGEWKWKTLKGLGLTAAGGLMMPLLQVASQPGALQEYMAHAYEQHGASGEALLITMLASGLGMGVGSMGAGIKSLIDSLRGIRKAKHEMNQARQDLDMLGGNTEAL